MTFNNIFRNKIKLFYIIFKNKFQACFGKENCTCNVHVFFAHCAHIRSLGPLANLSAFPYEGLFSRLRAAVTPGTKSQGKQIMEKLYSRIIYEKHQCFRGVDVKPKETTQSNFKKYR